MIENEVSPNLLWSKLGFIVTRYNYYGRVIHDNTGNEICNNAGYDTELAIARWLYFGSIV